MTCKIHLATDGKGRPLGLVLTAGHAADTTFFVAVLESITVSTGTRGRPRTRPERVLADKAYTAKANRDYLTGRGIKVTIPERADQKNNRARRGSKGGRPRTFAKDAYKGRNVVERCFNRLKQWRGIATRSDKTARSYLAGVTFAAALIWIKSGLSKTHCAGARPPSRLVGVAHSGRRPRRPPRRHEQAHHGPRAYSVDSESPDA